ncbi:MAG: HAD family phosphatase [Oscillospiraceae bacterium]|nr:HAD family phosphatase [Oscillospiraceae bacterium]
MTRLKAFIFDIDGTLVDSMGIWTESDELLLSRRGIRYSPELTLTLKSMTLTTSAAYLKEYYSLPESADEILTEITDIVRDKYAHEIKTMPYTKELLTLLKDNGVKICAATANSHELSDLVLGANGISQLVDFVLTTDDVGSGKDRPDLFRACAERFGTDKSDTAVVEDSPHSAQTAMNDGFFTIGVDSGHYGDFDALENCCDVRFKGFGEMLGILSGDTYGSICLN